MFVTSYATSSDMGGPSGGDDFCTGLADDAGLGGTWVAYLSGGGVSAITQIPDGPYVRLDGASIADDKADLTNENIANPINVNELGSTTYGFDVHGVVGSGTRNRTIDGVGRKLPGMDARLRGHATRGPLGGR